MRTTDRPTSTLRCRVVAEVLYFSSRFELVSVGEVPIIFSWFHSGVAGASASDAYKRISTKQTKYKCLYYIESEWATRGLPILADSLADTLLQLALSSYLPWSKLGAARVQLERDKEL